MRNRSTSFRFTTAAISFVLFTSLAAFATGNTGIAFVDSFTDYVGLTATTQNSARTTTAAPKTARRTAAKFEQVNDLLGAQPMGARFFFADATWTGTSSNAWRTAANWSTGAFPGSSTSTTNTDIVTIAVATQATMGINFNNATTGVFSFGGIDFGNATNRVLGNSTGVTTGVLTLNGATINATNNVIMRNSGSGSFTFQATQTGTMGVGLGNVTDNIINIESTGGVTISSIISGASKKLTKAGSGAGVLTLQGANTYSGDTTISAGTLKLDTGGTIASSPNIIVGSGSTFDVSTVTTALSLASSQTLKASGTGSNTTGTVTVASGKNLTLGATGGLTFTAYGGGATPPLTVTGTTAGALALNGAPITVTSTTPLTANTYTLIAKSGSATGVTGTPGTLSVSSLAANTSASVAVTSGQLILTVVNTSTKKMTVTLPGESSANGGGATAQTAGAAFNITLTATTDGTTVDTTYSGSKTVTFSGPTGSPTYPSTVTFTNGVGTANITLTKAETTTISATENTSTYGAVASSSLVVNGGAAATMVVTLPGQTYTAGSGNSGTVTAQTAGTSFNISKLTAVDANNNIATGYSGSKTISYSGPNGSPTYTTAVSFTSGQSTTTLATTLTRAETTTITATDGSLTGVASSSLLVNAGTATKLIVTLPGETFTSGTGNSGTVTAQTAGTSFVISKLNAVDANNNVNTSYTGSKTIAYSGPGGTTNYTTTVSFTSGQSTTTLTTTLRKAETTTITATDGTLAGVASSSLLVNPGTVAKLQLLLPGETAAPGTTTGTPGKTGTPSGQNSGTAISNGIIVNAVDANWNVIGTSTPNVAITSTDASAVIADDNGASAGNITLVSGTATLSSFTFNTAGSKTITATDSAAVLTANTSPSVSVAAGAASTLVITSISPATPVVGGGISVTVQSQDAVGNPSNVVATTAFSLTTNGNAGTIGGTTTGSITAGSNSVIVTGVTLSTTGTGVTLTATRTSGDTLTDGTSATFTVATPNVTTNGGSGLYAGYASLAAAITDLNAATINSPVTITLSGNETAPAGTGYYITATGTATNTITIQGSSSTVTAGVNAANGNMDAVFKIVGGDYITIQNFTILENPANTVSATGATNTMTEAGILLIHGSATDGAQNNTIQNNVINLVNSTATPIYPNSVGILSTSSSSTTNASPGANSTLLATSTAGTNSNNRIYSNTISNVNFGVYFICPGVSSSVLESGNDIGGTSLATANMITYGNSVASTGPWNGSASTPIAGIMYRNGAGTNIRFNTVTSNSLTVASTGINISSGTAPSGVTYTSTISDNTVNLTNTGTTAITGIDFGHGISTATIVGSNNNITLTQTASAADSATVIGINAAYASATNTCSSNTILVNQSESSGALSSPTTGLTVAGAGTTLAASSNNITINQTGSGTGTITGAVIAVDYSGAATTINSLSNTVLVNQTTAVASGITNAITGIKATSASTTVNIGSSGNGNNITFKQAVTGSGTYTTGAITYVAAGAGHGTLNVQYNSLNTTGSLLRATGTSYAVNHSGTIVTGLNVTNNTINVDRSGASSGTFYGTYSNASTSITSGYNINTNSITIASASSALVAGIYNTDGGTPIKTYKGNTISLSGSGALITGLNLDYGTENVGAVGEPNTISIASSATSPTLYGLNFNGTNASLYNIGYNNITSISASAASTSAPIISAIRAGTTTTTNNNIFNNSITGISTGTGSGSATINGIELTTGATANIYKNKIYDLSTQNTGSSTIISDIKIAGGTTTNIYNNLIGQTNTFTGVTNSADAVRGLNLTSTTSSSAINVYYNTVYLNTTSTGASYGSSAVFHTTSTVATTAALNLRNNIIVNISSRSGGTAVNTVAFRRSSGAAGNLANYASTSNNNLFYAGTPGTTNLIYDDGISVAQTIAAYKSGVFTAGTIAPRDTASISENPPFLSTSGALSTFLHINTAVATQIESGGANIATFTDDYDGDTRNATTPDIGADEFAGTPIDLTGPVITYSTLANTALTSDRTLSGVTISDATGVPTTGTLVPRIYYKKNSGSYFSQPGTLTAGSGTSGTWSFTIVAADMGGVTSADVVSYYVIAQDTVATPNISASPGTGLVATNVNSVTTPPTTPNTYTILTSFSGPYNVGVGQTYTTLTAAVAALNAGVVTGATTFVLTDATYPSETFPITINANSGSSATNTVTIKPNAGVTVSISGSSASGIFVLNGADYVTIDGNNAGTLNTICPKVTATRNLTITNTNTGATSAVIWLQTASADGATNNTIRNLNVVGSGNTQTLFGIGSGSSSISTTSLGTGNNSNTFENNNISATQYGIYSQGAGLGSKNTGNKINLNLINTVSPNNVSKGGIWTGFEDSLTISGNSISGIATSTVDGFGITLGVGTTMSTTTLGTNEVTNAVVSKNTIGTVSITGTFSAAGISVASATGGTNLIANNMLSGVNSNGTSGDFSAGILIGGGTSTTNVYFNTVTMTGTLTGANYPSFALAVQGSNPVVDIRNNILTSTGSTGANLNRALGLNYNTFSNLTSNNNDLFVSGTGSALVQTVNLTSSGATSYATLSGVGSWNAASTKDANSKNVAAVFLGATDLHLNSTSNPSLLAGGAAISVTDDIDCETRDTVPDIGADEIVDVVCSAAGGGTAAGGTSFCGSGSATLTASGYSTGSGTTYQWQYSNDNFVSDVHDLSGQTNPATASTGTVSATTNYRLRVACATNSSIDYSNIITVTVNPAVTASISPAGPITICLPGSQTLTATTSANSPQYQWKKDGVNIAGATNSAYSATAAGSYTVTVTDGVTACSVTSASVTATTSQTPTGVTASASSNNILAGDSVNLFSSSDAVSPTILTQNFETTVAPWTTTNTTTGGTPANVAWTQKSHGSTTADGTTINSPGGTKFMLSDSDAGGSGNNTSTTLQSPAFSLVGYSGASLSFRHFYKYWSSGDVAAAVEVSTNGSTWTSLKDYKSLAANQGSATAFASDTISLNSYVGNATVYVRFRYQSVFGYYWAIDDVSITGTSTPSTYAWTSSPAGFTSSAQNPTGVLPSVTTTYTVTVIGSGGCTSSASTTVNVTPVHTLSVVAATGGTLTTPPSGSVVVAEGATTPIAVTANSGYTFTGWTVTSGTGTTITAPGSLSTTATMGTTDATVTANFAINTYTVTYNGNGNTGGTAPVDGSSPYNYGSNVTVLGAGSLVRTGWAFNNWNTAVAGNGTSYSPGGTISGIAANTTLYAQWTDVPPTLTAVSIASNNANTVWAKTGDTVTLTFTASEPINSPTVTIAGHTATVSGGPTSWTASYVMASGDNEGAVPFSIAYSDLNSNAGTTVTTTTNSSSVTFDRTAPTVTVTTFPTVNIANKAAVTLSGACETGLGVTLSVTDAGAAHTVNASPTCTSSAWTASVNLTTLNDGTLTASASQTDTAGNTGTDTKTATKDTVAPSPGSTTIFSDNANPAWAKSGDKVKVKTTGWDSITTPSIMINARAATVTGSGGDWTGEITVLSTDTEGLVTFTMDFADAAGNPGTQVTAVTDSTSVTIDRTAPAAPSITGSTPASPNSSTTPTINGTAETGSSVTLYATADCTGTAAGTGTATGGNFAISVTVGSGTTTSFTAKTADAAGNISPCSTAFTYTQQSSVTITGTVTYDYGTLSVIPDVTLTSDGGPVATTNASGAYTLSGFGPTGSFVVTPSKPTQSCPPTTANGVTAFDASLVAKHVIGLTPLTGNSLAAADVSSQHDISSFDAALIARKAVALDCANPSGNHSGEWVFLPVSKSYTDVAAAKPNENYTAYMMGDVNGSWSSTISNNRPTMTETPGPNAVAASVPASAAVQGSEINIPLRIDNLRSRTLSAYQFDIEYDPSVVTPTQAAASIAGTLSTGLAVVSNSPQPGLLKVAVYGAIPVGGDGVYVNLRFTVTGSTGTETALAIRGFMFDDGSQETTGTDGHLTVVSSAGNANIRGRVLTATGQPVAKARVTVTDSTGGSRTIITSPFGYYEFGGLVTGETYTVTAAAKQHTFRPMTVSVTANAVDLDLIADQ